MTPGTRRIAIMVTAGLCTSVLLAQQPLAPPRNLRIVSREVVGVPPVDDDLKHSPYRPDLTDPPRNGKHPYFESLASRPEVHRTYSLRSQAQLAYYAQSAKRPLAITYDPENDSYPRRQDAAKVVIPPDKNTIPNQVRLPIDFSEGSILITWDAWFGREFMFDNHGILAYKNFQFTSPDGIWSEVRSRFNMGAEQSAIALVQGRTYLGRTAIGSNVKDNAPLAPQLSQFLIQPETWTRYWALFERTPEWDLYSLWMADENNGPVQLFDRLQLKLRENLLGAFWLEYATSTNNVKERGPLVGYVRNVVMLRNLKEPERLLERPTP